MDLIDTHVHLMHPELFAYPWCAGNPALQRRFNLEDYRAAAAKAKGRAQIQAMLFMEADVPAAQQAAETEFFARMADKDRGDPPLLAVIAAAAPETADFPRQLARLAGDARVRGLRRVLHNVPDELAQTELFAENLRLLAKHELTFDLCVRPRQLAIMAELAGKCPQTQFVLDHAGAPDVAGGEAELWREGIRRLAAHANVACKFSGLGSLADKSKPLTAQIRPYFTHCLECFYPERVLWGSDWPVSPKLQEWVETTAELLGELSDHEQAAIGTGNAGRIYRLN
jgi:predicted TIM-barrel fold metal-dependent hydrolase